MNTVALVIACAGSVVAGGGMWLAWSCIAKDLGAAARHRMACTAFWSTATAPLLFVLAGAAARPFAGAWNVIGALGPFLPDALPAQAWIVTVADMAAIAVLLAGVVGSLRFAGRLHAAHRIGRALRRPTHVGIPVVTAAVVGPLLLGYRRPMVLLPDYVHAYPPLVIEALVRHERAHARRHDNGRLLAETLVMALLPWCWPLPHLHRLALAAREELCDASALDGADDATRAGYAQALVEALRRTARLPAAASTIAGPLPALRRRLDAILHPAPPRRMSCWRHAAMASAILGCGFMTAVATHGIGEGIETVAGMHGMTLRFRPLGEGTSDLFHVTTVGGPSMAREKSFPPGDYRVSFRRVRDGTWRVTTETPRAD